jgi:hypothetical protein
MDLLQAGDFEGALGRFLESKGYFRSFANTANAAVCLEKLGRFDEALDMYRELVADFGSKFSEDERHSVASLMGQLRRKVGTIDVSSNVEGTVVIDSRIRGTLPLFAPLSALAGRHRVRVLKDGYASDDVEVEVTAGSAQNVELKLRPLTDVGRLAVSEASGTPGLEVLVDGAPVGEAPWKGTLSQGPHLVTLRGRDAGTAPTPVTVVVGQELTKSLTATPLGAEVILLPQPSSARLTIDGVDVGTGAWRGRLPRTAHTVAVSELGYFDQQLPLGSTDEGEHRIVLLADRSHPRWPREPSGAFHLGLFAQGGLGTGLGSDPERNCGQGCGGGPSYWGGAFLRGGYAFLSGWRLEGLVGANRFGRSVPRTLVDNGAGYESTDSLRSQGLWAGLGGGYALAATPSISIVPRLAVAVGFFSSRDQASVQVVTAVDRADAIVDQSGASRRSNPIFLMPSVDAELALGSTRLVAGLAIPSLLTSGPALDNGEAAATGTCDPKVGGARCARGSSFFSSPVPYRASSFLSLTLGVSRSF